MRKHRVAKFDFSETPAINGFGVNLGLAQAFDDPIVFIVSQKYGSFTLQTAGIIQSKGVVDLLLNIRRAIINLSLNFKPRGVGNLRLRGVIAAANLLNRAHVDGNGVCFICVKHNGRNSQLAAFVRHQHQIPLLRLADFSVNNIGSVGIRNGIGRKISV